MVTPARVVPLVTSPVGPLPAAPDVLTSHWYPPEGFEVEAVQLAVAVVGAIALRPRPVGGTHEVMMMLSR